MFSFFLCNLFILSKFSLLRIDYFYKGKKGENQFFFQMTITIFSDETKTENDL